MTIPPVEIGPVRHGKRDENYTVVTTVGDLGGHHRTTRGNVLIGGAVAQAIGAALIQAQRAQAQAARA